MEEVAMWVTAIYREGKLEPITPLVLSEGQRVQIWIVPLQEGRTPFAALRGFLAQKLTPEDIDTLLPSIRQAWKQRDMGFCNG